MGLAVHGRKGNITLDAGAFFHVTNFNFKEATEPYETTELAATPPEWKSFAFDGLKEVDGTVTVQLDDTNQTLAAGTTAEATFTTIDGRTWTGTIGIVDRDHNVDRNEVETGTYTFKGSGEFAEG